MRRAVSLYRGVVWMSVRCESCGFYGRSLCDVLVSCTVESYGRLSVVSVVLCHVEFSVSG